MSKESQAGLTEAQEGGIHIILISFGSGNKSRDDTIREIVNILPRIKTLNKARIFDLETVFENAGLVWTDAKELINLIKIRHRKSR